MWILWLISGAVMTLVMTNLDNRYIRFDEADARMRGMWVPAGQFLKFKEQLSAHLASDSVHSNNEVSRQEFEAYKDNNENRVYRLEELMLRIDDKLDRMIELQLRED